MKYKILEKLGLTETEAKIYMILLRLGSTHVTPIIKRAELHRATVYDVLDRLIEKGLVSYIIKEGKRFYEAAPPERFEIILEEKENKVKEQKKLFKELKPELEGLKKLSKVKQEAEVFQGKQGLKTVLDEVLRQKKPFYALGAQGNFQKFIPEYHNQWHKHMHKKKIKMYLIYSEKSRKLRTKNTQLPGAEVKFIDKLYDGPSTTHFYNDTILIVTWSEQPLIIKIKNKNLADNYKHFFNMIWDMAKK
jgi:HTH-type transcriptional regulator, sugar sensing transcriptional regulator